MRHVYAILLVVFTAVIFFLIRNLLQGIEMSVNAEQVVNDFNSGFQNLNILNYIACISLLVLTNVIYYRNHVGVYFFYTTLFVTACFVLTQVLVLEKFMQFKADTGLSAGGYTWTKVNAFIAALIIIFLNGFNYFILYAIKKKKQGDIPETGYC